MEEIAVRAQGGGSSSGGSSKKKLFFMVFGVIILLVALAAAVYFIRQRIVLEKKAVLGPGMYACGLRVNPIKEEQPTTANGGTYSVTFKIFYSGTGNKDPGQGENRCDGPEEATFTLEFFKCICPQGKGEAGGVCLQCQRTQETVTLRKVRCDYAHSGDQNAIERVISGRQPNGEVCGSFQHDVSIIAGPGNCSYTTHGPVWGLYHTNLDCGERPTPTPTREVTVTPAVTLTPSPTIVLTGTPTPTPTEPARRACFSECGGDSDCDSGWKCLTYSGTKRCLNPDCPEEVDCSCNRCWSYCSYDSECITDLKCLTVEGRKRCVKYNCPSESDCDCGVTSTPTPPTTTPSATPTLPPTGLKIPTLGGVLGGVMLISLGLALIF